MGFNHKILFLLRKCFLRVITPFIYLGSALRVILYCYGAIYIMYYHGDFCQWSSFLALCHVGGEFIQLQQCFNVF